MRDKTDESFRFSVTSSAQDYFWGSCRSKLYARRAEMTSEKVKLCDTSAMLTKENKTLWLESSEEARQQSQGGVGTPINLLSHCT
jgi:hypothetical protein